MATASTTKFREAKPKAKTVDFINRMSFLGLSKETRLHIAGPADSVGETTSKKWFPEKFVATTLFAVKACS